MYLSRVANSFLFTVAKMVKVADNMGFSPPRHLNIPTPGVAWRGSLVRTEGGAGSADSLQFCRKDSSGNYQWSTIAGADSTVVRTSALVKAGKSSVTTKYASCSAGEIAVGGGFLGPYLADNSANPTTAVPSRFNLLGSFPISAYVGASSATMAIDSSLSPVGWGITVENTATKDRYFKIWVVCREA